MVEEPSSGVALGKRFNWKNDLALFLAFSLTCLSEYFICLQIGSIYDHQKKKMSRKGNFSVFGIFLKKLCLRTF